jgi:hypothetical protein
MMAVAETMPTQGSKALGLWTNEGARLTPSCSPNHGKDDDSVGDAWPSALRARKRWQALWLKP